MSKLTKNKSCWFKIKGDNCYGRTILPFMGHQRQLSITCPSFVIKSVVSVYVTYYKQEGITYTFTPLGPY